MEFDRCIMCTTSFGNAIERVGHYVHHHHATLDLRCPNCSRPCRTFAQLLWHQKVWMHHSCNVCFQQFADYYYLLDHFLERHTWYRLSETEIRVYCMECFAEHPSWDEMFAHMESQHTTLLKLLPHPLPTNGCLSCFLKTKKERFPQSQALTLRLMHNSNGEHRFAYFYNATRFDARHVNLHQTCNGFNALPGINCLSRASELQTLFVKAPSSWEERQR